MGLGLNPNPFRLGPSVIGPNVSAQKLGHQPKVKPMPSSSEKPTYAFVLVISDRAEPLKINRPKLNLFNYIDQTACPPQGPKITVHTQPNAAWACISIGLPRVIKRLSYKHRNSRELSHMNWLHTFHFRSSLWDLSRYIPAILIHNVPKKLSSAYYPNP